MILVPAAVFAAFGYLARVIDRARLKQTMQRLLLGGSLAPEAVEAAAEAFAERVTATGVFAGARERIAADRAAGYRLVMATASYRFYVGAIAERLGFDDVIATEAEIDETGRLYAKMVGDNVYGPEIGRAHV